MRHENAHLPTHLPPPAAHLTTQPALLPRRHRERPQVFRFHFRIHRLNTENLLGAAEESYNTLSSGKMMVPASKRQLFTSIRSVKPRSSLRQMVQDILSGF